jgi:SulP family sulfate permease
VPVRWIVLDARAIPDIDYTGADTLRRVVTELSRRGVKLVLVAPMAAVRAELDVYGITPLLGENAYFYRVADAVEEFRKTSV